MNTQSLLPLTAALFSVVAGAALLASTSGPQPARAPAATTAADSARIVDLPAVSVRPDPQDLAFFQASRIVDLDTLTVRPDPADRAAYLAARTVRIVDMPVVSVRPAPEDLAMIAAAGIGAAQQLATR